MFIHTCIDPSISVSISGDVGEARAFKSSSSREQSGETIYIHTRCYGNLSCIFAVSADDDSGDSDTEAEEQRKVGEL